MKGIGIGVIGWGMMGQAHTYALRSMPLLYPEATFTPRLACVCARQLEHAKRAAELAGFDSFTDDYTVLLRRNDVDVVSICTPNGWHEEMALRR